MAQLGSSSENLPRDATGKAIPFETKELHSSDGQAIRIESFVYRNGLWHVVDKARSSWICDRLLLDPPNGWERLLEDLDVLSGRCEEMRCEDCGWFQVRGMSCESVEDVARETARRIRALRGDGE